MEATLSIQWQRLLSDGETCDRCRATEKELDKAVKRLKQSLPNLGLKVHFEKYELSDDEFQTNPRQSNRILINGKSLETWLQGDTGQSECCDVCGEEECRTVIVQNEEYEVVPTDLIVKAALKATSHLVSQTRSCCSDKQNQSSCCSC